MERRQSFKDQCIHNEVVAVVRDMVDTVVKEQQINLTEALKYIKFCHASRLTVNECRVKKHLFRCPRCAIEFTRWKYCEAHVCQALAAQEFEASREAIWRLSPTEVLEFMTECDRIRKS